MLNAFDWLDRREDWVFVLVLYVCRWIVLAPILLIEQFAFSDAQKAAASISPQLYKTNPLILLGAIVILSPLFETLVECSLPYFIISRLRRAKQGMPARPWGFVFVSAILMAIFHPMIAALLPSLITGMFLAYCYGHFAYRSLGRAILATTAFHGAINFVGWTTIMMNTLV